ncbi:MAG: hypothetical protein ACTHK7_05865 [Aureliella sp.]
MPHSQTRNFKTYASGYKDVLVETGSVRMPAHELRLVASDQLCG